MDMGATQTNRPKGKEIDDVQSITPDINIQYVSRKGRGSEINIDDCFDATIPKRAKRNQLQLPVTAIATSGETEFF